MRTPVALLIQAGALAGTFLVPGLGSVWWHHVASLTVVLAAVPFVPMRSRRFLAIGALATAALAAVSGFVLLYWKEGIRPAGIQDWGVWWHVAWSWAAAVLFFQHTWINRVALSHFFLQSFRSVSPGTVHAGGYALALTGIIVTAGPGKAWFDNESYIPLSVWTWLVTVATAYAAWWMLRRRDHAAKKRIRGGIDLALVPATALAVASGIPILWFDGPLAAAGLQYASKYWHVAPSIVFSVLVAIHSVQLWGGMRAHLRNAS